MLTQKREKKIVLLHTSLIIS